MTTVASSTAVGPRIPFLTRALRQVMLDQGITSVGDLAKRINVSNSVARSVLNGAKPTTRSYPNFAAYLGMDVAALRSKVEGSAATALPRPAGFSPEIEEAVSRIQQDGIQRFVARMSADGIEILRRLNSEQAAEVIDFARQLLSRSRSPRTPRGHRPR